MAYPMETRSLGKRSRPECFVGQNNFPHPHLRTELSTQLFPHPWNACRGADEATKYQGSEPAILGHSQSSAGSGANGFEGLSDGLGTPVEEDVSFGGAEFAD